MLGLNLIQGDLKMKFLEPRKVDAFLWHGLSHHSLIRKLYHRSHIGNLIISLMVYIFNTWIYFWIHFFIILRHICINNYYNSINFILIQETTTSRSHISIFLTYLYGHLIRFNIVWNYCKNRTLFLNNFLFLWLCLCLCLWLWLPYDTTIYP